MTTKSSGRRSFLKHAGLVGSAATVGVFADTARALRGETGTVREQVSNVPKAFAPPANKIKFGVCGISHDHIYGMSAAIQRGGGELVVAWGDEDDKIAAFRRRFPDVRFAKSQDEVLADPSIQLVLSSEKANERAGIGIRAMKNGKDFLSDKPAITTLEDLAAVRKTIAETKRIFAVMYSERLEVKAAVYAGELIKQGAIGKVIQTINIAPHQIVQKAGLDGGGLGGRPEWFYQDVQYGGILCDIGSHQIDQFLYYTGSTQAEVVSAQIANVRHPLFPHFQDFGDMTLRGDSGLGYVRLDWFTPRGLGTWGDGRLFVLGADGYIEIRKYADVAVKAQGNNLFIVDNKEARYIDCNAMALPFGPQFVDDVVNRTHVAQDQTQCLLAAELSIQAQKRATRVTLKA
ncbi:MAG: Gfo/Idh/MocA family oxidoreductase [Vicinamibacteria bacterium]